MKAIIIAIGILVLIFFVTQAFMFKGSNKIEMYPYEVVQSFENFEIRQYEARNFSTVTMPSNSYKESSGNGFRTLAGYIFGKNQTSEKIAMTSPVAMEMGDSITMAFMIPNEYDMNELPKPNDKQIKFQSEPAKTVAAVQFGGWASDERIEEHKMILKELLDKHGIRYFGNFSYLGYNPPFELINRRNEVIVQIDYPISN